MTPEDMDAKTSVRRRVMVLLCALWVVLALVRLAAWIAGHPGDRVSLTFALVAGLAGAIGLTAALLPRRGQQ